MVQLTSRTFRSEGSRGGRPRTRAGGRLSAIYKREGGPVSLRALVKPLLSIRFTFLSTRFTILCALPRSAALAGVHFFEERA